jgi:hypothetical protein
MRKSVASLFQIEPDNFIARLCHNIYWYAKDYKIANSSTKGQDFDQILENFYPMFSEETRKKAELLAHKIKVTR